MFLIKRKRAMTAAPSYWVGFDVVNFNSPEMGLLMFVDLHSTQKNARRQLRFQDVRYTCRRNGLLMITGLELNFHARNAPSCISWTKIVRKNILFSGWKHPAFKFIGKLRMFSFISQGYPDAVYFFSTNAEENFTKQIRLLFSISSRA